MILLAVMPRAAFAEDVVCAVPFNGRMEIGKTGRISAVIDLPRLKAVLVGGTKGLFLLKDKPQVPTPEPAPPLETPPGPIAQPTKQATNVIFALEGPVSGSDPTKTGQISAIVDVPRLKAVLVGAEKGLFLFKDNRLDGPVSGSDPTKTGQISTIVDAPRLKAVLVGGTKGLFLFKDNRLDGPVSGGEQVTPGWVYYIVDVPRLDTVLVGAEKGLFEFEKKSLAPVPGGEQTKTGRISTMVVDVPRLDTVLVGAEKGLFEFEKKSLAPVPGSKDATHGWISSIHKLAPKGEEIVLVQGAHGLFMLRDRLAPIPGEQTKTGWISSIADVPRSDTVLVGAEKGLFLFKDNRLEGPVPGGEQTKTGRISAIANLTSLQAVNVLVVGYKGLFTFFQATQPTKIDFKPLSVRWKNQDGMLSVQAGGGIVADSDPDPLRIEVTITSRCAEAISNSQPELIITELSDTRKIPSGDDLRKCDEHMRVLPCIEPLYRKDVSQPSYSTTMLAPAVRLAGEFHPEVAKSGSKYKLQVRYKSVQSEGSAPHKTLGQHQPIEVYPKRTTPAAIVDSALKFIVDHLLISICILIYLMLAALCGVLWTFWPLTLLNLNYASVLRINTKIPWIQDIPLRHLLIIGFFHNRPRVLDAWVRARIRVAREKFEEDEIVKERSIHITLPVKFKNKNEIYSDLTASIMRPVFDRRIICLLICAEGGAGKTHIACRICRWVMEENVSARPCTHQMLPLLLNELEGQRFIDAVGRKLQYLVDDERAIPQELLEQLLRKRRVLVIVDHLSEMSREARAALQPGASDFPVNALVVTSRLEEDLGMQKTVIEPQRITGAAGLAFFMEQYIRATLAEHPQEELMFGASEILAGGARLLKVVGEKRDITPLLAKLYAEQMVWEKQCRVEGAKRVPEGERADNIPDLMLEYLNRLNSGVKDNKLCDSTVQRDAKVVAWKCVSGAYAAASAELSEAIRALMDERELTEEDARRHLGYLSERLKIIQIVTPSKNYIRFTLDPLAEYLGGLHAVEVYGNQECLWRKLFTDIRGERKASTEFLLALQECCLSRSAGVPSFVVSEVQASIEAMKLRDELAGTSVNESG